MKPSQQHKYLLDGKPVYGFLFCFLDRMPDGRQVESLFQVEGFSKDHAWKRLCENKPNIPPRKLQFVDTLEPEHDVGYLGEKLPMFPYGVAGSNRMQ